MRDLRYIILAMITMVVMACAEAGRSVEVRDFEPKVWDSVEEFKYINEDSLSRRDIAITLRYDRGYRADSIPMHILTISPDSLVVEEPFTLRVPHLAELLPEEQTFIYRRNVVLKHKGAYTFRLKPDTTICGIASVGIIVSNTPQTTK